MVTPMNKERQQYYLRAEPTAEGRALLRAHQEHLAETCVQLRVHPRLTRIADLHWTALFLGSPERWTRVLRTIGAETDVAAEDLLDLAFRNTYQHLREYVRHLHARPAAYDVFFGNGTHAVFVLALDREQGSPARMTLEHIRGQLSSWEQTGRVPRGTVPKLLRHPAFPLSRERSGGKPHSTLARGRVSRTRRRDVRRSIRATRLASHDPITFGSLDLRTVGSPAAVTLHA